MNKRIKQFIEENIELIENNEFDDLYYYIRERNMFVYDFTQCLLDSNIDPLPYMNQIVPSMFAHCLCTNIYVPDNIEYIAERAFADCPNLGHVSIPNTVTALGSYLFVGTHSLTRLEFRGTKEQFFNIKSRYLWNSNSHVKRVVCTDGIIEEA